MRVGILEGVQPVLHRHLPPDVLRGPAPLDVRPDERGEGTSGTQRGALPAAQGELGVALGLLLEGDGQDRLVLAGLDVGGGHDGGGATHRAGGVDPEHGLAHRTEGVGQIELRLHHALEEVGRLAQDHGVNVCEGHLSVVESPEDGLAHHAAERSICRLSAHASSPIRRRKVGRSQ